MAESIPKTGPLVVVANHPYGVLDGIAICWLVAQVRKDFKILINNVLCRAPEMAAHTLPVDFDATPEALQTNLTSRKQARQTLDAGGVVIVFPAGAISTTPRLLARRAEEVDWARWSVSWCAKPGRMSCRSILSDKIRCCSKSPAILAMPCALH